MDNKNIKVAIIGAGPGGLTAGLLLAHKGFQVEIFEKSDRPGGRNSDFELDGHRFDLGPTFLMMKYVLDEVFKMVGERVDDHLKLTRLSPMYRLFFENDHIDVYEEKGKMMEELDRMFPGEGQNLSKFYGYEEKRFKKLMPCLTKDYSSLSSFFSKRFIEAIPHFSLGKTLYGVLGDYFKTPETRLCFTFQSKYIGMSPWRCPGAFGMIPYVEHAFGIYHVEGGLSEISRKMAELFIKKGGKIHYNSPVKQVLFKSKKAIGLEMLDGSNVEADKVIVNADFAYSATNLMPKGALPKYSAKKLAKKDYSCSTVMIYLGLKKQYDLPHHSVIFAKNYRKNVDDMFSGKLSGRDLSFYVRNATVSDRSVSPEGKSQLYILVPCPNKKLGAKINWEKESQNIRNAVMERLKDRLDFDDIESQIETERIITPDEWEKDYNVYYGATFNLSHRLLQMLWLRPRNRLEGVKNVYLVGGGTHPGSGLPTIYESGRISAELLEKDLLK
jgi:phytoene desaturase